MEQEQKSNLGHVKNKHTDDLIDHYWGSINYVSNLIRASEIKAGLVLVITSYSIHYTKLYEASCII